MRRIAASPNLVFPNAYQGDGRPGGACGARCSPGSRGGSPAQRTAALRPRRHRVQPRHCQRRRGGSLESLAAHRIGVRVRKGKGMCGCNETCVWVGYQTRATDVGQRDGVLLDFLAEVGVRDVFRVNQKIVGVDDINCGRGEARLRDPRKRGKTGGVRSECERMCAHVLVFRDASAASRGAHIPARDGRPPSCRWRRVRGRAGQWRALQSVTVPPPVAAPQSPPRPCA